MRAIAFFMLSAGLVLLEGAAVGAQDIYVYPTRNQSDEQTARDKEECHDWAVKQTGVDPVKVAEQAPEKSKAAGGGSLLGGAGLGAARGAAAGDAGAGAMHGVGMAGLLRVVRARRQMQEQHESYMQSHQEQQNQLDNYDRAYGACLSGRGYTVR